MAGQLLLQAEELLLRAEDLLSQSSDPSMVALASELALRRLEILQLCEKLKESRDASHFHKR